MPEMRLFVAIILSEQILAELANAQRALSRRSGGQAGRWVKPDSIHLTLKFLGDVDTIKTDDVCAAIERGCHGIRSFTMTVSGLGCFPNTRHPRIVWAGVEPCDALTHLQSRIEAQLAHLDFAPENRPFRPHLTLARIRRHASSDDIRALGRAVHHTPATIYGKQEATRVALIRSNLRPTGAIYTTLFEAILE